MDFGTMKAKLHKFQYTDPADILEDIRLIFTNCQEYNQPAAPEYLAGQRLCRVFVRKVKELKLDAILAKKANGVPKENGQAKSAAGKGGRRSGKH